MLITKKFLDTAGRRSQMVREAMLQAGNMIRIRGLKEALISMGVCVVQPEYVKEHHLPILKKEFSFTTLVLNYVLLDKDEFDRFEVITSAVMLEVTHMRNGLIGLRRG